MGAPPEERYTSFHVQVICRTRPAHSGTLCIVELIMFINSYLPDIWTEFKLLNDELWSPYKYCLICKTNMLQCAIVTCYYKLGLGTLYCSAFSCLEVVLDVIPNAWHLAQDL